MLFQETIPVYAENHSTHIYWLFLTGLQRVNFDSITVIIFGEEQKLRPHWS
jgi:hypothetical protein